MKHISSSITKKCSTAKLAKLQLLQCTCGPTPVEWWNKGGAPPKLVAQVDETFTQITKKCSTAHCGYHTGICITKAMNRPLTGGSVEAAAKPWLITINSRHTIWYSSTGNGTAMCLQNSSLCGCPPVEWWNKGGAPPLRDHRLHLSLFVTVFYNGSPISRPSTSSLSLQYFHNHFIRM